MPAMTIFSGTCCNAEALCGGLAENTGYKWLKDQHIIKRASELSGLSERKISRAMSDKDSVFNEFTHEKERSVAFLRLALSHFLTKKDIIFDGFAGLLIPHTIHHILRLCLIAGMAQRIRTFGQNRGIGEDEALSALHAEDQTRRAWVQSLHHHIKDPWDPSLYDIVVPTDKMAPDEIVALVDNNLKSEVIQPTQASLKAVEDFILAAQVQVALAEQGHAVDVTARDGMVTLTLRNNVLMLGRLEEELKKVVNQTPGVKSVETRIAKGLHQTTPYRRYNFQVPSKVLLVDDEREFVRTLSERLLMRDMGSAIAYDGESALSIVADDEPDVMVLDLKMPGIDGTEVLRKVKARHPDIEVIILTGHGSKADEDQCLALGAFAYMQKPVDIDLLSETLKKANEKMHHKKQQLSTG
ncbi:MAG: response regulator [Desulfatitalea sp.]|nr:response regulator [Desulfatitalea sp.]NNK01055.1 response regulator [Desulfatitalea sp.]